MRKIKISKMNKKYQFKQKKHRKNKWISNINQNIRSLERVSEEDEIPALNINNELENKNIQNIQNNDNLKKEYNGLNITCPESSIDSTHNWVKATELSGHVINMKIYIKLIK